MRFTFSPLWCNFIEDVTSHDVSVKANVGGLQLDRLSHFQWFIEQGTSCCDINISQGRNAWAVRVYSHLAYRLMHSYYSTSYTYYLALSAHLAYRQHEFPFIRSQSCFYREWCHGYFSFVWHRENSKELNPVPWWCHHVVFLRSDVILFQFMTNALMVTILNIN